MLPRPARPDERSPALQLLLSHLPALERDARRFGVLDALADGSIDPAGLLVLPGLDRLLGAVLAAPAVGGGGVIWPPASTLHQPAEAATALIEAACAWLRTKGARLVQSLVEGEPEQRCRFLLDNGFRRVTLLISLAHTLEQGEAAPHRLTLEPYDEAQPEAFHRALASTYEGSLDCPEVTGVRSVEEVVAGHKVQGVYGPANWWLARHQGEVVGVLLQVDHLSLEEREVAYIGIVPSARRKGHARELLVRAIDTARAAGFSRLALAVDERNAPAWQLYAELGFVETLRQQVFLRLPL
jgi:GNAT superfamily N-acetyltransferase